MYSSLFDHLFVIGHYIFAFCILIVLCPRAIFATTYEDRLEQSFSNALRIVALYIIMGYLLVLLKLFEVLAIIAVLLFIIFRKYFLPQSDGMKHDAFTAMGSKFYELLEVFFRLKLSLRKLRGKQLLSYKGRLKKKPSVRILIPVVLLLIVIAASGYVRLYDAWMTVAPSMSDGSVTLAWMNYISQRILFHDGVYPQGMYIMLSYMHKFAAVDQIYIAKFSGPIHALLIVFSLYFTISRLTKSLIAGIIAAAIYGLSGEVLHGQEWFRHSATNGQEFALLFLLPTLYFFYRYFEHGRRSDFWSGAAGCTVIGLVHFVIFAYVGLGMAILMLLSMWMGEDWKRRISQGVIAGIGCVIVAAAPMIFGFLFRGELHSTSAEFLTQEINVTPPLLGMWDIIGLICIAFLLLRIVYIRKVNERWMYWFVVIFGGSSFIIYEYAGTWTQNAVVSTRSGSVWILSICFLIGMTWHMFSKLTFSKKKILHMWIEGCLCASLIAMIITQSKLEPIIPYKMMWDSAAAQYLHISEKHLPSTWIIFSDEEGFPLVLGKGAHNYIKLLLTDYDPKKFPLTKKNESIPDSNIAYHIYIIEEKKVFRLDESNGLYQMLESRYERKEQEYRELRVWLDQYEEFHDDLETFYEDKNIKVYYIHRAGDPDAKDETIWGRPRLSEMLKDGGL